MLLGLRPSLSHLLENHHFMLLLIRAFPAPKSAWLMLSLIGESLPLRVGRAFEFVNLDHRSKPGKVIRGLAEPPDYHWPRAVGHVPVIVKPLSSDSPQSTR